MLFSEMLCHALKVTPEYGDLSGTCCICNRYANNGFKKKFGANFTSSEFVSNGDIICPECNYLVNNSNTYRRTMFLLTSDKFIKFKKKEAKDIIFNLPNEPFYIYLTKTWQKIGWIRMNEAYNLGNENIINFIIDYDVVSVDLNTLKEYCDFIKSLRDLKISKKTLENGMFEIYDYKKIKETFEDKTQDTIKQVQNNIHNPIWEFALYIEE